METSRITVERAKLEDLPEIMEALREYHFLTLPAEQAGVIDPEAGNVLQVYNEVTRFDLGHAFVARVDGAFAGCCHYRLYAPMEARTTLLVVREAYRRMGVGRLLQEARMRAAYGEGAGIMLTSCDTEEAARWYERHFGYRVTGEEPNCHRLFFFEADGAASWGMHYGFPGRTVVTMLACDLKHYFTHAYAHRPQ